VLVIAASAFEWVKALSPIVAALIAVVGAALVTSGVSDRYEQRRDRVSHENEQRRKQRDFDLETMQELASLYGQIFGVWKAWDTRCRFPAVDAADHAAWTLLSKAVDAEGRLEALLLRIAADRPLRDPDDIRILAGLRQSFKILRKAIRAGKPLGWRSSIDRQYAALKAYAASTTALVSAERTGPAPDVDTARAVFQKITSNEYEPTWEGLAADAGWTATTLPTEPALKP
jgi:hypothetical protein